MRQLFVRDSGGDYHCTANDFTKEMFKTAASAITAPPNLKSVIFCKSGPTKAIQTYILFFTPRLRVLDLEITPRLTEPTILGYLLSGTLREDGDYHLSDFVTQEGQESATELVENPTLKALYFHELEDLRLCIGGRRRARYPINLYEGVLLLPKLKTLSLTNFSWLIGKKWKMKWGSVPCLLTKLELHNCWIEPLTLSHILTRCKNLKHLTVDLEEYSKLMRVYDLRLYGFGDALRELGGDLETLMFSTKAVGDFQEYSSWPTILGCLGSLKELRSLLNLSNHRRITRRTAGSEEDAFENGSEIVLADALPHSLKTLHLITEGESWWDQRDRNGFHAFHERENEQVCNLLLSESCPELCRVDITRITPLTDIEGKRFEITSELDNRWHMEKTLDEKARNGTQAQLHTALCKY